MKEHGHLFRGSELNVPKRDFKPFPAISNEKWLARLLEEVRLHGVTAVDHRCTPRWHMVERRVSDDMLFYITQGRGRAVIEGRSTELRPGVCAHFRRGQPHAATTDPKNPIHVISLHYTATVFESLTLPELLNFPDSFDLTGDDRADEMFRDACREFAMRPAGCDRGLEALGTRIVLHLIREHGQFLEKQEHEAKLADLRRLLPALEAMREHLTEAPFIPQLAKRAGLSEAQFRRLFARTMRRSPVQHLRRIRMERACQLLRHTNQTIEWIASEVGYAEPAFFAHSFKKLIGISPGKYRSTHEL
jgi:AraC-like DNA-binding protein/mannose-6-phosphate isomerase-like protein (cupin superfamily)